ncbi:hypothetical protein NL676_017486 [Syzygium grande]|nr:hypothetical protein NL676_017486 [Syzygium grande]
MNSAVAYFETHPVFPPRGARFGLSTLYDAHASLIDVENFTSWPQEPPSQGKCKLKFSRPCFSSSSSFVVLVLTICLCFPPQLLLLGAACPQHCAHRLPRRAHRHCSRLAFDILDIRRLFQAIGRQSCP